MKRILTPLKAALMAVGLACVAIGCADEEPPPPLENEQPPNPDNPDIPPEPGRK